MKHMKKREWSLPKGFENEPDIVKGYHCGIAYRIMRHPEMGHLCGYIKLPQGHPWLKGALKKRWGKKRFSKKYEQRHVGYDFGPIQNLSVHGGVTFFGRISRGRGHWVGFDCAHYDDFVPSMGFKGTYRDIEYVLAELRGLVSQMMPCSTAA